MALKGRRAFRSRLTRKLDRMFEVLVVDVTDKLIDRTPQDSGRLAANWRVGIARADDSFDFDARATDVARAKERARAMAKRAKAGDTVFVTNAGPYAGRVEFGGEHHRPAKMVGLTSAELPQRLREAIRRARTETR